MNKYNIKTIDYLKGIMAIGIVLFHYNKFTLTAHNDINFPLFNILNIFYTNGNILVEFFFLVSGFCFFNFYAEKIANNKISGKKFFLKRFFRLYPLYIITTIIILPLQYFYLVKYNGLFDSGISLNIISILLNIFCLTRGWIYNSAYPYNAPAWFLNVIILDYIIFYIINKFIKNKKIRINIIFILIILGLIFKIFNFQYPIFNVEMGRGITNFFMGGIVVYIYNKINENKKLKKITIMILFMLVTLLVCCKCTSYYYIVLIFFPSILLIFLFVDEHIPKLKGFSILGKISFSMYLLHYCYICFIKILPININYYSTIFLIIYLITLIGLSYISYVFIEQKISKYFEKFINYC